MAKRVFIFAEYVVSLGFTTISPRGRKKNSREQNAAKIYYNWPTVK